MKHLPLSLAALLVPSAVFAAALFERPIATTDIDAATNVLIAIPDSVLLYHTLDSLRVTENGSIIATTAGKQEHGELSGVIESVQFCSLEAGYKSSAAHDGDTSTVTRPDPLRNPSSCVVTLNFSMPVVVDAVTLSTDSVPLTFGVSARDTNGNTVKLREVKQSASVTFSSVTTQSLTLSLTYDVVPSIAEVSLTGRVPARLLFRASPGKRYALVYGETNPPAAPTAPDSLFVTNTTPYLSIGSEIAVSGDSDGDGLAAQNDNCPTVKNADQKDSDGDSIGDACDNAPLAANAPQDDRDNDGVGDRQDNCPTTFNPDQRDDDLNGVGYVCDDADNDGVMNSKDNCPRSYNPEQKDTEGDGIGDVCQADRDGDGLADATDNCRYAYNPDQNDEDKDGIGDACDSCPKLQNSDQADRNENGIGDACEIAVQDPDGDRVNNDKDNCPSFVNIDQKDTDNDGFGDRCDTCPTIQNTNQRDSDNDGQGDACEDEDGDGLLPHIDNCPLVSNEDQTDKDNDGIGDACEDEDGDGIVNATDNCKYKSNRNQGDEDADGQGDSCDDSDDRFSEQHGWVLWIGISVVVLALVGVAARMIAQIARENANKKS